jgi:hypothetical protein
MAILERSALVNDVKIRTIFGRSSFQEEGPQNVRSRTKKQAHYSFQKDMDSSGPNTAICMQRAENEQCECFVRFKLQNRKNKPRKKRHAVSLPCVMRS